MTSASQHCEPFLFSLTTNLTPITKTKPLCRVPQDKQGHPSCTHTGVDWTSQGASQPGRQLQGEQTSVGFWQTWRAKLVSGGHLGTHAASASEGSIAPSEERSPWLGGGKGKGRTQTRRRVVLAVGPVILARGPPMDLWEPTPTSTKGSLLGCGHTQSPPALPKITPPFLKLPSCWTLDSK